MPRDSRGELRYPSRPRNAGASQISADGVDLGPPMLPQDVFLALRVSLALEDDEILDAFELGAARVERDPDRSLRELSTADRQAAIDAARQVTRSRLQAWRKRARHMTWLELRILFVGLREQLEESRPE